MTESVIYHYFDCKRNDMTECYIIPSSCKRNDVIGIVYCDGCLMEYK
jgi:hypothetical protein